MNQIHEVRDKVTEIEFFVRERIPSQRKALLSKLFGMVWMRKTIRKTLSAEIIDHWKKLKLSFHSLHYKSAEQSEKLLKLLYSLDDILSNGDDSIRNARKEQVLRIQNFQKEVDIIIAKCADMVKSVDAVVNPILLEYEAMTTELPESDTENEEVTMKEAGETSEVKEPQSMETEDVSDDEEMSDNDCEDKDETNVNNVDPMEEDEEEEDDEDEAEEEEEESRYPSRACFSTNAVRHLPQWRPRYNIKKGRENIYIQIHLPRVEQKNVLVEANEEGYLKISGFKFPSKYDLIQYQWKGIQEFGRFVIHERISPEAVDLSSATYQMVDDIFVVQLPRRYIPTFHRIPERRTYWPAFGMAW